MSLRRREYGVIKMFDYFCKKEFEKHRVQMEKKGWHLIDNGMFGGSLNPTEQDDEHWKFTACYLKSDMY